MAIFIARDVPLSAVAMASPHNAAERIDCEVRTGRGSRDACHASDVIHGHGKIWRYPP
jgi:hypothetical protein